jgi:hypothetical protein
VRGLDRRDRVEMALLEALLEGGRVGEARFRRVEADLGHRLAKQLPVLGLVDRLGICPDHLDVEAL